MTTGSPDRVQAESINPAMPCVVVIPCYDEARRLNVKAFEDYLSDSDHAEIRFLFVNDGSKDQTLTILERLHSKFPDRVEVLDLQPNRGKAEAVRQGMQKAILNGNLTFTGFWDADLATPLEEIKLIQKRLLENQSVDMVFGARVRLLGHDIHRRLLRHYLGRCFATAASMVLRLHIYDTQCGAKLFRVNPALVEALSEPFQSRWIFDVELIARFVKIHHGDREVLRHKIFECPVMKWADVAGSKVTPFDFFKAFGELVAIYLRY